MTSAKYTLRKAPRTLQNVRQETKAIRVAFLHAKAKHHTKNGDNTSATIARNIQKAKELQQMFQKLKGLRKPHYNNNILYLEVPTNLNTDPKECNDWTTVKLPDAIEKKLLKRNQNHFGQAEGTPVMALCFKTSLGYEGNGPLLK